ncbi:hypothetical protein [Sphingomonas sp. 28-63-12]|uniref:hypothetical protein n=1 Tax=Sphingomonas sp. 28-63-12 TaxID=1970434 RepID=UPI000BCAF542|nr:MAG: hypothetical protein B7Y47_01705 [Sphingomonas sp. 28-63-12]
MSALDDIVSPAGQQDYGSAIAHMVRHGRADEAEARLAADIARISPELWDVCGQMPLEALRLEGWAALGEALAGPDRADISAVGIDITGRRDSVTGEPCVDLCFYDDACFPFSSASHDEILADNSQSGATWHGVGEDVEAVMLTVEGMAMLHGMIEEEKTRDDPPEPGSQASIALFLADWWRSVQFHRLVHREMVRMGLPRPMVVVIGSRDCGPFLESVMVPDRRPPASQLSSPAAGLAAALAPERSPEWSPERLPERSPERSAGLAPALPASLEIVEEQSDGAPMADPAPVRLNAPIDLHRFSAVELRRKLAAAGEEEAPPPKTSLFGRLFARR